MPLSAAESLLDPVLCAAATNFDRSFGHNSALSPCITMANFSLIFGLVMALNVVVTFRSSEYYKKWIGKKVEESEDLTLEDWKHLIKKYLLVYLLATMSDWLQGPYVYALYSDYGYSQHDIAVLFVAGFGSSMVFGSFIGGMADWGGRRAFVLIFSITYALSCVTKRTLSCFVTYV
jgi:hypothetical protein